MKMWHQIKRIVSHYATRLRRKLRLPQRVSKQTLAQWKSRRSRLTGESFARNESESEKRKPKPSAELLRKRKRLERSKRL